MSHFSLYGVNFERVDAHMAAKKLTSALNEKEKCISVFTPNIKILLSCKNQKALCPIINSANLLLPDGAGISTLCHAHKIKRTPRVTGIDMGYFMLRYCASHGLSIYLLGGRRGVAERAANKLSSQISNLNICGTHHGYFDKHNGCYQNNAVIEEIRLKRPALLLVCFGFPEQELWIKNNLSSLPTVRVCMGLGGSLDVWSGDIKRAPLCMRVCNLEWLWRNILKLMN